MKASIAAPVSDAPSATVDFHDQGHPRARLAAALVLAAALCAFGYSLGYQRGRAAEEVPSGAAQVVYEQARLEGERAERAEQAAAATVSRPPATTGLLGAVHP